VSWFEKQRVGNGLAHLKGSPLLSFAAVGTAAYFLSRAVIRYVRRFDFQGRNVLITGGSRGLGLVMARQLVRQGARIAICARDAKELEHAENELSRLGRAVLALTCDVTDRNSIEQTIQAVRNRFGRIDVLINNAGVIQVGPQENMVLKDYEEAMQVHYWGPLYAILAVLPEMRRRGEGRIVNISSIGGLISVPHLLPYSASKFALVGLSEGFRAALFNEGIYVTTVCPGLMRTGSAGQAWFKGQNEQEAAWFTVSSSVPGATIGAERAAAQVLKACRDGRAHIVLSLPAKIVSLIHGVAPGLTADALGMINGWLPEPGGIGTQRAKGYESRPDWLPGWTTHLGDQAAERNNELVSVPNMAHGNE
jgi:NAD(P)-dependent dehydrogenase (short-subunit alcohol dehydrogenase family)